MKDRSLTLPSLKVDELPQNIIEIVASNIRNANQAQIAPDATATQAVNTTVNISILFTRVMFVTRISVTIAGWFSIGLIREIPTEGNSNDDKSSVGL